MRLEIIAFGLLAWALLATQIAVILYFYPVDSSEYRSLIMHNEELAELLREKTKDVETLSSEMRSLRGELCQARFDEFCDIGMSDMRVEFCDSMNSVQWRGKNISWWVGPCGSYRNTTLIMIKEEDDSDDQESWKKISCSD